MAKNSGSEDKYFEALDFIINILKKHEQILDKSIQELATLTEHLESISALYGKVENAEEKISVIQNEVTQIIGDQSNVPKEASQAKEENQAPQTLATHDFSKPVLQSGLTLLLNCKQWEDFAALAMHAQTLSFSYKEDEAALQAHAVKGNQMIKYTGALPSISIILKKWLTQQLDITDPNVLEGFWDNP